MNWPKIEHCIIWRCTKAPHSFINSRQSADMCSTASTMANLLNVRDDTNSLSQIEQSNQRIVDLTQTVSRVKRHEAAFNHNTGTGTGSPSDSCKGASNDWTGTYRYWSGWDDVEELQNEVSNEESRLESMMDTHNNPMGHCHSHTEVGVDIEICYTLSYFTVHCSQESRMFEQPEEDKMRCTSPYDTLRGTLTHYSSCTGTASVTACWEIFSSVKECSPKLRSNTKQ